MRRVARGFQGDLSGQRRAGATRREALACLVLEVIDIVAQAHFHLARQQAHCQGPTQQAGRRRMLTALHLQIGQVVAKMLLL